MRFLLAVFLLWTVLRRASCLAASSSSSSSASSSYSSSPRTPPPSNINNNSEDDRTGTSAATAPAAVVVSTKKNGGHARRFYLKTSAEDESLQQQQLTQQDGRSSPSLSSSSSSSLRSRALASLRSTFLPVGFSLKPSSSRDDASSSTHNHDYLRYAAWSCLQDVSTSLRAILATQRVLEGVGVGQSAATALSAAQNFLLRDAAGMAATLLFTATAAAHFAADVKRWRLLADVMVDVGITLEVAAVQLPRQWFLPALCLGNMCKAVCGVAAGATGGSLAVYWADAVRTNISDVHAKFGAQHTVTASLGLVLAAVFARSVATAPLSVVWTLYALLTALHVYANVQCLRLVAFPSFNAVRLEAVLSKFLDRWSRAPAQAAQQPLPTPADIASQEPLFFVPNNMVAGGLLKKRTRQQSSRRSGSIGGSSYSSIPIQFGLSFNDFVERSGCADPQALLLSSSSPSTTDQKQQSTPPYLISTGLLPRMQWIRKATKAVSHSKNDSSDDSHSRSHRPCIVVACAAHCTPQQKTQAYVHAALLRRTWQEVHRQSQSVQSTDKPRSDSRALVDAERRVAEQVAGDNGPAVWEAFRSASHAAGWDLSQSQLHGQGYEIAVVQ